MKLLACLLLLSPLAAQTGAWQPPIAAPPKTEDRTPPAWVASVRAEVAAAVAEAMAPVVASMREQRPASMPAPVVVVPPKEDRPPPPVVPGSVPWELILSTVSGWVAAFLAYRTAVSAVRKDRGASWRERKEQAERDAVEGKPAVVTSAPALDLQQQAVFQKAWLDAQTSKTSGYPGGPIGGIGTTTTGGTL